MTGKIGKHINKILVFMLNLLLMAIAVLVIKQKEEAKKSSVAQDELKNNNSFLDEENAKLKNDLESLKGVLNSLESKVIIDEPVPPPDNSVSNSSTIAPNTATQNTSNVNPAAKTAPAVSSQNILQNSTSNNSITPANPSSSTNSTPLPSNSKTKSSPSR